MNLAALRRLRDEAEIGDVLARYARGIDHMDYDAVRSCYHPDASDAHGSYNGDIEGFIAYSQRFAGGVVSKTHHMAQSVIELEKDRAWVETYCLCLIRYEPAAGRPATDRLANIRYVDLFERRAGVWKIARRKVIHHPGRLDPVGSEPPFASEALRARLDRDDPAYDRRPESFRPDR